MTIETAVQAIAGNIAQARSDASRPSVKNWEAAVASIIGGTFLTFADTIYSAKHDIKPVTTQISEAASLVFPSLDSVSFENFAFFIMIGLGLALCFVYQPKSRLGAFVRGSSVIAVLVGMNIGTAEIGKKLVSPAGAASLQVSDNVQYTTQEPREFGVLGLGTKINGKSNADLISLDFDAQVTLNCIGDDLEVGDEVFCHVSADQARNDLGLPNTDDVWILRD